MTLTLQNMRDHIRSHLDLETDDLPDSLIDTWVREGSKRVERAEPYWPFYENITFTDVAPVTVNLYSKSSAFNASWEQINAFWIDDGKAPLRWVGYDALTEMAQQESGNTGRPYYWAEWNNYVSFWPALDTTYTMWIRGYRMPLDWVADGAGASPDLPDDLHNTVLMWALNRAYLQQEDAQLAAVFERQYADELNEFRRRITITPPNQPLVLNGGAVRRPENLLVRPRFDWEVT